LPNVHPALNTAKIAGINYLRAGKATTLFEISLRLPNHTPYAICKVPISTYFEKRKFFYLNHILILKTND